MYKSGCLERINKQIIMLYNLNLKIKLQLLSQARGMAACPQIQDLSYILKRFITELHEVRAPQGKNKMCHETTTHRYKWE